MAVLDQWYLKAHSVLRYRRSHRLVGSWTQADFSVGLHARRAVKPIADYALESS